MDIEFAEEDLGEVHPNTAQFELGSADGRSMTIRGSSVGGGDVVVTMIDSFEVEANGELPMLVVMHRDRPGEIAAVSSLLARKGINIAAMRVSREHRGALALMLIETDAEADDESVARILELDGILGIRRVPAV